MRIGVQDVLLLLVGLAFTIVGGLMLVAGPERGTALAITAFFGACTAVFAWNLAEKRGLERSAAVASVSIAGGVKIPMLRGRIALLGGGLLALGTLMATAGSGLGVAYVGASVLIAAAGLAVLGGLLVGRGRDYLVFEVKGLRFGLREGSYLVRWSDIAGAEAAMYQRNPIVLIWLAPGAGSPIVEGPASEAIARRYARTLERSRSWLGADLSIVPVHYGLDAVLLSRAIVMYAVDPERRQDLAARGELPEAGG